MQFVECNLSCGLRICFGVCCAAPLWWCSPACDVVSVGRLTLSLLVLGVWLGLCDPCVECLWCGDGAAGRHRVGLAAGEHKAHFVAEGAQSSLRGAAIAGAP